MSRRRMRHEFQDFERWNRGHGDYGPRNLSFLFEFIFSMIALGFDIAFKVISAVTEAFFGRSGQAQMPPTRPNQARPNPVMPNNSQGGNTEPKHESTNTKYENMNQPKKDVNNKEPKKEEKHKDDNHHGIDGNAIIFALTLIPAIVLIAIKSFYYAGGVVALGIALMIIFSSIRSIFRRAKENKKEKVQEETVEAKEEDAVEQLVKDAFDKVFEIRNDLNRVSNMAMQVRVDNLCNMAEKIIGEVRTNPESLKQVKKFFYYYLDAFGEIFKKYLRLSSFSESSDEVNQIVIETEKSFEDIENIFKGILETMLEQDMMNLKAEINVMKNSN